MDLKQHWDHIYQNRANESLGWYASHLQPSLDWITTLPLDPCAAFIDVGGGTSTLVDDLLAKGWQSLTILDLSEQALANSKARLGEQANQVTWIAGDILTAKLPPHRYSLWHDRALFHFFTEPAQQQAYRNQLSKTLKPQGHLILGVFAPEAPPKCSGLPVQRYDHEQLAAVLGSTFSLRRHQYRTHTTPGGVEQRYLFAHFQKMPGEDETPAAQ